MASMSNIASLSKYMTSFPDKKFTILIMVVASFITGVITFLITPFYELSFLDKIIFGGLYVLVLLGFSAILNGFIQQFLIYRFDGINMELIHSLYLSFLSMIIMSLLLIIATVISVIINVDLFLNTIVFGSVLIIGLNTLVIKSACQINIKKSALIGLVQPILIIVMYILLSLFLNAHNLINDAFMVFLTKTLVPAIIMLIAVLSFIHIVEAPLQHNLGISTLGLLSEFIKHLLQGSLDIEKLFDKMGEPIETLVSFISFKNDDGIKSLFVVPCVHPGPLGKIGGSNMPTILANKFDFFTMVAHGPSRHDFNPVAVSEIDKIEEAIKRGLENTTYSSNGSEFVRYTNQKSKIGVQFFNDGMLILSTFAPEDSDDIDFGVGLTMMVQSIAVCNVENSIVVDCHNSFAPNSGEVLAGNPEVSQLTDLINTIEKKETDHKVKVGIYSNNIDEVGVNNGLGESGLKIMVVEVNNQRTAYVLFDGNNMEKGFRDEIFEATKDLVDEIEVMTTDTHSVNAMDKGYNPVGIEKREELLKYAKEGMKLAIDDLEEVEVGIGTEKIENLKTFGPTKYTEFVATLSSIISVAKVAAPVLFIAVIIFAYVWIYFVI